MQNPTADGLVSLDDTDFLGNILAGFAVSCTGVGSSLVGRALAHTAVTMTGATIIICGASGETLKLEKQVFDAGQTVVVAHRLRVGISARSATS